MSKRENKDGWSQAFIGWCDRNVPNSMVFAWLLTIIVVIMALIFTDAPVFFSAEGNLSIVDSWVEGFWSLLQFAMQMSLVMLSGYMVANAPVVSRGLARLAQIPKSAFGAYTLCIIAGFILNYIHWGLGMMASVMLTRHVLAASAEKNYHIHKPTLVAAIYTTVAAAVGIAQAAPISSTQPGYLQGLVSAETGALLKDSYALTETVLSPLILVQCLIILAVIFVVGWVTAPKDPDKIKEIEPEFRDEILASKVVEKVPYRHMGFAQFINNTPFLNLIVGGVGLIWCIRLLATEGIIGISLNNFNFLMICLAAVLCWTPEKFAQVAEGACSSIWGVVIQFPFYAGIFGIIAHTGLADVITSWFMAISTTRTWPVVSYLYSAIMNLFVPSGGSKFVIEAPYILDVTTKLGCDVSHVICGYCFGDLTTNIIQPFWALPYMALTKTKFKDVLPQTFIVCLFCLAFNAVFMFLFY